MNRLLVLYLVVALIVIASHWKIFMKAGQHGWTAIIPILNILVLLRVVKRPLWWIILFLIPIVNIIVIIVITVDLAKKFGKSGWYAVGLIFLGVIFYPVLAFGDSTYQDTPEPLF